MTHSDARAEKHLAVLSALSQVARDSRQFVELLASAEDDDDALRLLRHEFDFTREQAQAVLDAQFRLLTRRHRDELAVALQDGTDAIAAPWEPPLNVEAKMYSPQTAVLAIAGVEHRVEGKDLYDCLERVAALVRERIARPQRRRVAITTGLADGPTRILVDPLGSMELSYESNEMPP